MDPPQVLNDLSMGMLLEFYAIWRSEGLSVERGDFQVSPLINLQLQGLLPERDGQNLVLTVLCVPSSLDVCAEYARLQGYLAHKKTPLPLGPPYDPKYSPTIGS